MRSAEIRLEIPLNRIAHVIAIGGDVRFAVSQIAYAESDAEGREIPRERFLAFCGDVERLDEETLVGRDCHL